MPDPAKVPTSVTIEPVANGFIVLANMPRDITNATTMIGVQPTRNVFSTFAQVSAWLKAQGWTV